MNPYWTVGPVWVKRRAGIDGASTILNRCVRCGFMPKDDFMRYLTKRREHKGSQMSRARCSCVHCGAPSENEMGSCIVTMQHGDDEEVCVVYQAEILAARQLQGGA